MTVEDSDNDDEERDPDMRCDPVESDADSVLDALQRDLEVDVASACPAAADAPPPPPLPLSPTSEGSQCQDSQPVAKRLRVVARGDIRPPTVSPTPRTTQLEGESAIASGRSATVATLEARQIRLNQVSYSMGALWVGQ